MSGNSEQLQKISDELRESRREEAAPPADPAPPPVKPSGRAAKAPVVPPESGGEK